MNIHQGSFFSELGLPESTQTEIRGKDSNRDDTGGILGDRLPGDFVDGADEYQGDLFFEPRPEYSFAKTLGKILDTRDTHPADHGKEF